MPLCQIRTNLPDSKIPDDFLSRFSRLCVDVFPGKKPESVLVALSTGQQIMWGGSTDPAIVVTIHAMDLFNEENNKVYGPKFLDFFTETLSLPENRIEVVFFPVQKHQVAVRS